MVSLLPPHLCLRLRPLAAPARFSLSTLSIPYSAEPCTYEANTHLISLINSGRLADARHLFNEMPHRDSVSWTTIISGYLRLPSPTEALILFYRFLSSHRRLPLDPFILSLALKASNSLPLTSSLHSLSLKSGLLPSSPFVSTALLKAYSSSNSLPSALQMFDEMPHRTTVSYTAAITALVRASRCHHALRLFASMHSRGIPSDSHAYAIAIKACTDAHLLARGQEVHAFAAKLGLDSSSFVANTLATMYSKCGDLHQGSVLFRRMSSRDVVSWTNVIATFVQVGRHLDAVRSFISMTDPESAVDPNEYTYAAVISAAAGMARADFGEQLHSHVIRRGLARAISVANALVTMYSNAGNIHSADTLFRGTSFKDLVSWSAIISAHSQAGHVEETFRLFEQMRGSGTVSNEFPLASLLSACASATVLEPGRQVHAHALRAGLAGEAMVASALINMYAKCGSIGEASHAFDELGCEDVISWTAMINGFAEHGLSFRAMELFDEMLVSGRAPDYVTFVGVLSACSHVGLVHLGAKYFELMKKYGIKPGKEHYGCMVDLLGRAGRLRDAEKLIEEMPHQADDVVWSALLRACQVQGDVDCGRRTAERILKEQAECAGTHITLANIFSAKGMWREAAEMRKGMRLKGVRKEAGWSWIEVGEGVSVFASGDKSHPREEEIYETLELFDFTARVPANPILENFFLL